jgi:hypothetical protein
MEYDDFLKWQESEELEDTKPDPSELYKLERENS